jgi:crossover junction endodeoxyribonuclease RuvC
MTHIAVDPGSDGSASLFENERLVGVMSFKFNTDWETKLYLWCIIHRPKICVLEKVGARPGQGTVSMFTFGGNYRAVQSVMKLAMVDIKLVRPQEWQMKLGIYNVHRNVMNDYQRKKLNTETQIAKARELFPDILGSWDKIKQGDVFASALIGAALSG